MGIPISKSRAIEVDGQQFRWMARRGRTKYRAGQRLVSRVLTVQEAKERPGAVFQLTLWPKQWSDWDESMDEDDQTDDMCLVPADVIRIIQIALIQGWEPGRRGAAYKDKIMASVPQWSTTPPSIGTFRSRTRSLVGR